MPDTFSILKPPLARLLTGLVLPQFKICCQNWRHRSQCKHHHHHHYRRRIVGQSSMRQVTSKLKSSDSLLKCGYGDTNSLLLLRSLSLPLSTIISMTGAKLFRTSWDEQSIRTHWLHILSGNWFILAKPTLIRIVALATRIRNLLKVAFLLLHRLLGTHIHTGQPYVLLHIYYNIFGSCKLLVCLCLDG